MKRQLLFLTGTGLCLGLLAVCLFAQSSASSGADGKLDEAVALLKQGKPEPARELLASIDEGAPEFAAAQCYQALCLHELKDYHGFLKQLSFAVDGETAVGPEVREELAFKEIHALHHYRRFDDVLMKIQAFQRERPGSARQGALAEYQLATLFERGMKKTIEACGSKDTNVFNRRWNAGRADLEEFLSLMSSFPATNYSTLPKRALRDDMLVARLTLGQENEVLAEAGKADAATLEKVSLLRVQLYQKLQPEQVDRNLKLMGDFLRQFPESKGARRVQFDAAGLSYQRGKELILAADAAEAAEDMAGAREKRNLARQHFEVMRALQAVAVEDREQGIAASDIRDLQEDLLCSYALEKNYNTVLSLAEGLVASSEPGELNWIMGKEYRAIVLANQNPPQTAKAIAIFDELLELGFNGKTENDRLMVTVARWRVTLALQASDLAAARRVIQQVQDGSCVKNFKQAFLRDYATYAPASTTANAK